MKKYIYFGLTAVISGGLSAAATYFVTKKHFEAKMQAEIEEIREIYREKEKEMGKKPDFVIPKEEQTEEESRDPLPEMSEWGKMKQELRKDYEKYAKKYIRHGDDKPELEEIAKKFGRNGLADREYPREEDSTDEEEAEIKEKYGIERVYTGEKEDAEPYTISFEAFTEDQSFEKVELWYYADGIIGEENPTEGQSMVTDVEDILGYENLKCLEGPDPDDETYIRNPRFGTDYIVYREEDTFAEAVLGVTDEDRFKKNERKRGRREDE